MSWIVNVHACENNGAIVCTKEFENEDERQGVLDDIFEELNVLGYDEDELTEELMDVMAFNEDDEEEEYTISVFKKGEPDPYDGLLEKFSQLTANLNS